YGLPLLLLVRDSLLAHIGDPRGPGVLPLHIRVAAEHRLPRRHGPGQVRGVGDRETCRPQHQYGDLAQDQLFGEVLRTDGDRIVLGPFDRLDRHRLNRRGVPGGRLQAARCQRCGQENGGQCAQQASAAFHHSPRGRATCSTTRPSQSTSNASNATSNAPENSRLFRYRLMPVMIRMPNPPPLMKAASVAVPTSSTSAVRTPARITGTARGSSTRTSTARADIPIPRPASTSLGSTPFRPTMVLRSTGRIV